MQLKDVLLVTALSSLDECKCTLDNRFSCVQIANAIIRIARQVEETFSDHPESVILVLPSNT